MHEQQFAFSNVSYLNTKCFEGGKKQVKLSNCFLEMLLTVQHKFRALIQPQESCARKTLSFILHPVPPSYRPPFPKFPRRDFYSFRSFSSYSTCKVHSRLESGDDVPSCHFSFFAGENMEHQTANLAITYHAI